MIIRIVNEPYSSNTYLICNESNSQCVIIDPGLDEKATDLKIAELNLKPIAILSTHGHFDHISGVSFFREKYSIPFYIHKEDVRLYKSVNFYLKLSKLKKIIKVCEPDFLWVTKHQLLILNEFTFEIFNYPGHTKGSCIIQYKNNLFTGDIIFKKGLYLNKLPEENVDVLKESILEIISNFDLNNICYPGHGHDASLNEIKTANQDLIKFINN